MLTNKSIVMIICQPRSQRLFTAPLFSLPTKGFLTSCEVSLYYANIRRVPDMQKPNSRLDYFIWFWKGKTVIMIIFPLRKRNQKERW